MVEPPLVSLADYAEAARRKLTPTAHAFLAGGAADEFTLKANEVAFDRQRLKGRVLADLQGGNTRVELLGHSLAHPLLFAPVAHHRLAHPDGERATMAGAAATGTLLTVSTQTNTPLEEIAAVAPGQPWWFQVYWQRERAFTLQLVRQAEAAGATALVVTLDAAVSGVRYREWRARFQLPPGMEAVLLRGAPEAKGVPMDPLSPVFGGLLRQHPPMTRADWQWLRAQTRLPLLAKGVMAADDVELLLGLGVDALIVSNHGGRTLDTLPATLEVLPEIVAAVAGRVPVVLDGGVRRGTDVVKALALGAKAVMLGRPQLHGLAVGGASGVAHLIQLLRGELETAMALVGCPTLEALGPQVLWHPPTNSH